jgi:hypothetical protein
MGWPEVGWGERGERCGRAVSGVVKDMNLRHHRCAAINFGVWEY